MCEIYQSNTYIRQYPNHYTIFTMDAQFTPAEETTESDLESV